MAEFWIPYSNHRPHKKLRSTHHGGHQCHCHLLFPPTTYREGRGGEGKRGGEGRGSGEGRRGGEGGEGSSFSARSEGAILTILELQRITDTNYTLAWLCSGVKVTVGTR